MRRFLICIVTVLFSSTSRAQISEQFSDGDYTSNPTWTVNALSDFSVAAGQLRSANTSSNTSFYICTTNTLSSDCVWEFWVNLQFATSGSNYVDAYLLSDNSNLLASNINGYFVRIGNTSDDISLYKSTAGTQTVIIDGVNSSVASSSNNLIKIKVTRSSSYVFTLERDITGTGNNYISEGTITDGSFTSTLAFGFVIKQSTAGFFGKHLFDDIAVSTILVDVTPPGILSNTVVSNHQVDVLFDEPVEITSAQTIANYTVNNSIGSPTLATRDASNTALVHLAFSTSFINALSNTLTVTGVRDLALNTMTGNSTSFVYMAPVTMSHKDIVINEIYADPSPLVNLTTTEFIELYNRSSNSFNLNGLKLTDGTTTATLGNYTLVSNGYVIVCAIADTSQFNNLGYTNRLGVSSFPSLNNSGDNLYLKTAGGVYIDSVNYSDTWYRDAIKKNGGWTLEQINPSPLSNCSPSVNWIASNDTDGGTPGFINSVYSIAPDITGPKISSVTVLDSLHISICFDDMISASQLSGVSNYTISGGIGSPTLAIADHGNMCATLSLMQPLLNASNYTISLSGLTDCSGNSVSPNVASFSHYKVKPYDVVINELMADPDPSIALPNEEYVELKNRTNFSIHLNKWTISTPTSTKSLPDITIQPNGYTVLTGSGVANQFLNNFGIIVYEVPNFPSLSNSGSTITLRDSNHVVISSVSYSLSWYHDADKDNGGWSLEQIDANNPCGGQNNWHASTNPNGGTPSFINSVAAGNADIMSPALDRIIVLSADTIALLFSEPLDSVTLSNASHYIFDHGLTTPAYIKAIAPDFKKVILKLSAPMQAGMIYNCTVLNSITDCVGNALINGSLPFALPEAPEANDMVINEVLFDPTSGGVDFVELYNRSQKTIDLKDVRIGSMDTMTSVLKDTEIITNEGYLVFPESYVVISENGGVIQQQYFSPNPKGFLDVSDLPSMNSDEDVVTLSDRYANIIDNFKYSSKMHFPLLATTKGVSLERIDFNRPTNDKTNWNSAAESFGFATPAYRNSQYLQADGGNGISIPNPLFSPDNDGYNDVLNIHYKLDEPGKAANVFIYDSKGRQVRHLIKNEQLVQDGVMSWNGINDTNEKAPIGIYVVYVELFNLSGKVNKYKLSCTLAGKL
ncbi:MAG: lamin tail domain-containing protein [Bacteroidetes bacterium]|nr:lamin tail domain-containing protein [Bacteroidota bacterium]